MTHRLSHSRRLITAGFIAVAGAFAFGGCNAPSLHLEKPVPAAEAEDLDRPFLAPITIVADLQEESIVRVVGGVSCTGTLIGERLVLTAHHCVVEHDAAGKVTERDVDPSSLRIELGGDDLPWGGAGVKAIVTPACGYKQGRGDIAILVLNRELVGMVPMIPRITEPPKVGEEVTPWGFGRCSLHSGAIRRQDRDGGPIEAVGHGIFQGKVSVCPGDSGGPVLNARREVVGVVSAAVMDSDARTRDVAYFARIDEFQQLFSAAQEIAESGASPAELPPYRSCE